jgi:2-oxo-4-hydroxy-4-carboxy-5-ureidoimidazoline decarboxylase
MAGALLDDWPQISATRLHDFNRAGEDAARELLRGCLDVDRWIDAILAGRPYGSVDHLLEAARSAANPLTDAEVEHVCPRRGEDGAQVTIGVDAYAMGSPSAGCLPWEARAHLADCLDAYHERFGRPFVIRRAGRSGPEIMAKLETRLRNDPDAENRVVAAELRQIALLRLAKRIPV